MKAVITSGLVLLASHLALVLATPTPTIPEPPSRKARAVGDTTQFPVSDNEMWTLTVTIQSGSGNGYDDDDLESVGSSFANAVANAGNTADGATATYMDDLGNSYELDLSLDDGTTIGSKTNAYWAVAGNTMLS